MLKFDGKQVVDIVGGPKGPISAAVPVAKGWTPTTIKDLLAIRRLCRGKKTVEAARASLPRGQQIKAARAPGKVSCGFDVNKLILGEVPDGQDHKAPCPKCGQEVSWRPPRFVEEDAA